MIKSGLILVCFFLSGATALIYEVVWMRWLVLIFGTTGFAVSTILTAFMTGLSLGSYILGRFSHRIRQPLVVYGLIEIGIGVYALLILSLLHGVESVYVGMWFYLEPGFYLASILRFALGVFVLILPTMLMGGTLPLLSQEVVRSRETVGLDVGRLYGLNTVGAVVGTGAAGFFLLPVLGMTRTESVAVFFNFLVGLIAIGVSLMTSEGPSESVEDDARRTAADKPFFEGRMLVVLLAFALSGFAAMVYEVAWTRLLTLILGSSIYGFTIMLLAFLCGLALGSLLMAKVVDRLGYLFLILAALQTAIGLTVFAGEFLFNNLPYFFLLIFQMAGPDFTLLSLGQLTLAFFVMLPATLLFGMVFPVVIGICTRDVRRSGYFVGWAYAVNTAGTVLGSFAAGFILLPLLGIQGSLHLGIAINLISAIALIFFAEIGAGPRALARAALTVLLLITLFFRPGMEPLVMASGVYKDAPLYLFLYRSPRDVFSGISRTHHLLFYHEGLTATVSVIEKPTLADTPHLVLTLDGKPDASTGADMSTQVLSAHLPLLLRPEAETVLVVGLASGVTVGSVARYPVKRITVVEIEPSMVEAQRYFSAFNHEPLKDPRVEVVLEDARNYFLRTGKLFDVIISEPSNPWMSGPAKLFTREFFILGKKRLRSGGLFAQWVQLYGMAPGAFRALLRTFYSVFPHVLLFQTAPGDLILIGSAQQVNLDVDFLKKRLQEPGILQDLYRVGVKDEIDLLSRFRLGTLGVEKFGGDGSLNTDDNGLIEFSAPLSIYMDTVTANRDEMRKFFEGINPYLAEKTAKEDVIVALGLKHLRLDELSEARKYAEVALSSGKSSVARWILGEIQERQGNRISALREWEKALELNPRDYGARMSIALFAQSQGKKADSVKHLVFLSNRYPADPLVQTYYGIGLYLQGNYEGATTNLEAARSVFLSSKKDFREESQALTGKIRGIFASKGFPPDVLTHYYLSNIYQQVGLEAKARRETDQLNSALSTWREELSRRPFTGEDSYLINVMSFHESRASYIDAEKPLVRLVAERVVSPLAHFYRGTTLYFLGYFQDAIKELKLLTSSLGGDRKSPLAEYYLGLTYHKLGENENARIHLESFLRLTESGSQDTVKMQEVRRILGLPKRQTS